MTTIDVMNHGVIELQHPDEQRPDAGRSHPVQQGGTEGTGSFKPTETTPVLIIHAASDRTRRRRSS